MRRPSYTFSYCIHSLTVRVTSVTDEDVSSYIAQIVTTCKYLQDFEIISTQLFHDIPDIICESIIACAKGDSIITQNKRARAQDAFMVRQKKQEERNDLKTEWQVDRDSLPEETAFGFILYQRKH